MKIRFTKSKIYIILLIISILTFNSCSQRVMSDDLPGVYSGKQHIMVRYDKGGQYIFITDSVQVNLSIDSNRKVSGWVGEAVFEGCKLAPNRGWIGRTLNIKTDFLIRGKLTGKTFSRDSISDKEISIPFNIVNSELKGSLFLTSHAENLPMISSLKLIRQ